ncbi:hypothetical protein ILYODFUR_023796 [Ilyodon furcidens]|uniref:Uncharacterized protein n=1 Tax=Ilyodon furcidens TaxID=33524 RepID=A0ABV0TAJ8_9TELE
MCSHKLCLSTLQLPSLHSRERRLKCSLTNSASVTQLPFSRRIHASLQGQCPFTLSVTQETSCLGPSDQGD